MASRPVARIVVEICAEGDGIAGTVAPQGGRATPFSGWLELLALLGGATADGTSTEPGWGSRTDHQ